MIFFRELIALFALCSTPSSRPPEKENRTSKRAPSWPLPIKTERKEASVMSTSIWISRLKRSSMAEMRAAVPAKKKVIKRKRWERISVFKESEKIEESARKKAPAIEDLRVRFFPHFLEFGVKKGLMLSSFD